MMTTMTMMIIMIGMMMMMMTTIGKCGLTAELRLHARKLPSAHLQNIKTQKQNIPHKSKTYHTKDKKHIIQKQNIPHKSIVIIIINKNIIFIIVYELSV